jgi:hypothetical protein
LIFLIGKDGITALTCATFRLWYALLSDCGTFRRHVRSVDVELGLGARKVVVCGGAGSFQDGDVDVRGIREWLRE